MDVAKIMEIIEKAMADEKKDYQHYKSLAQEAEDPENRAIFEALASEEEKHYRVLKDRLTALKLRRQKSS